MRNMPPADELAHVRAEIRALRAREAELRDGFLAGRLDPSGIEARIRVKQSRRKVFLRERLPTRLQTDPALWETRLCRVVQVEPLEGAAPSAPPGDEDDFDVIEPW
ncbi:hypothetical protein E0K89_016920 [Aquicoccus sp. SCR17]|nr:hypothetical protein [Carideicomes alvinocaridis]